MLLHKSGAVSDSVDDESLSAFGTVITEASVDPLTLDDAVLQQPLIEIAFESFTDGRGSSVARFLRSTMQYQGTLRASGDCIPDQLLYRYQVGFDEVLVDAALLEKHGAEDWLDAQHRCSLEGVAAGHSYTEPSVAGQQSLWQQRRF